MNYKTLGKSGLRISPLCLGGMTLGEDWGWGADTATSNKIIHRFIELGGNFIDTANIYTNTHSEKIIGDLVAGQSALRNKLVIGTKFGGNVFPGNPNGGGNGTKSIMMNVHESLRRLQTDYIDLLWIHQWDWYTGLEETMRTLNNLVNSGKVLHIGVSYSPAWKIAQAQTIAAFKNWAPFIGLQIEYSLLQRTVEDELIPMAMELGLGVTSWAPLKGGLLSGKYNRLNNGIAEGRKTTAGNSAPLKESELVIIDKLIELAEVHHTTPANIALAWVMERPGVDSVIIGTTKPEQLEANAKAVDIRLSADETAALDQLSKPPATFVNVYSAYSQQFHHGGITVNGNSPLPLPLTKDFEEGKY